MQREWNLWTPFEEALLDLPSSTDRKKNKRKVRDLITLRENVIKFAYAIALVIPWRKQKYSYAAAEISVLGGGNNSEGIIGGKAKTFAGSILEELGSSFVGKFVRAWELIDEMFLEDKRTLISLDKILEVDSSKKAVEFKEFYGKFWAGHVLCGAIFRWCEICEMHDGRIGKEEELEEVWGREEEYFRKIALAVDRVRWDSWGEEKL